MACAPNPRHRLKRPTWVPKRAVRLGAWREQGVRRCGRAGDAIMLLPLVRGRARLRSCDHSRVVSLLRQSDRDPIQGCRRAQARSRYPVQVGERKGRFCRGASRMRIEFNRSKGSTSRSSCSTTLLPGSLIYIVNSAYLDKRRGLSLCIF